MNLVQASSGLLTTLFWLCFITILKLSPDFPTLCIDSLRTGSGILLDDVPYLSLTRSKLFLDLCNRVADLSTLCAYYVSGLVMSSVDFYWTHCRLVPDLFIELVQTLSNLLDNSHELVSNI